MSLFLPNPNTKLIFDFTRNKEILPSGYAILACLADTIREQSINTTSNATDNYLNKLLTNNGSKKLLKIDYFKRDQDEMLIEGVEMALEQEEPVKEDSVLTIFSKYSEKKKEDLSL